MWEDLFALNIFELNKIYTGESSLTMDSKKDLY